MKFFNFKKKNKNAKIQSKDKISAEQVNSTKKVTVVKPKMSKDKFAKINKRNMIRAARAARKARSKAYVRRKPFTRIMSLILAGLMLFGFVSGAAVLIWNFFFPPKSKMSDLGDMDMQKMLENLEKLKDQRVDDEAQPVDDGENEEDEGDLDDADELNDEQAQGGEESSTEKKEEPKKEAQTGASANVEPNASDGENNENVSSGEEVAEE